MRMGCYYDSPECGTQIYLVKKKADSDGRRGRSATKYESQAQVNYLLVNYSTNG